MATRNRRRRFKKSSIKTFGFFLIFSAIVWVLVQFSKTYTQVIEVPVNYLNVPLDKSISDERPDHVDLQLQDNGFSIYYYKIFNLKLDIDLSEATESDKNLIYSIENHITVIEQQLKVTLEDSRIIQDEIVIPFQFKKEKMLKIISNVEVSYAVGYSADEPLQLVPDSVKVSGPEEVITKLSSIPTLKKKLENVNSDLDGSVKLDTTGYGELSFYENSVRYTQKVEKFTEGKAEIPVEVINVPDNLNLAYFPKSVVVYYQVNLEEFEKVGASDFSVVCDYKSVKDGDDYMIGQIKTKPKFVNNIRLNERRIQFVIKR
ncbi:YbbR-like domain-containing protein [uncultured Christiangramia sp.]|uniref:YbbR-like domain-containing protein n=1 Tax=uncultured Christiangramia sp. TaxID=503836 RepID=UPI0025FFAE4E|nr:YbbR-like domain-containing protein [uncultured Christiangramia sp.]|tara:strand:+ start:1865 stop:2815 length:951 start_codon:yes stop_codon:yes gene_type:complete